LLFNRNKHNTAKPKINNRSNIVTNAIKTLKMVHVKKKSQKEVMIGVPLCPDSGQ